MLGFPNSFSKIFKKHPMPVFIISPHYYNKIPRDCKLFHKEKMRKTQKEPEQSLLTLD